MKPVPVANRRIARPCALMMLDDTEMALQLATLAESTTIADTRRAPTPPIESEEVRREFHSAALLVLDRDEAEALEKELEEALRPRTVLAA